MGFIVKRNGPAQGNPASITYDFVGIYEIPSGRKVNLYRTAIVPTRRISSGAQVIAAAEGDPAELSFGPLGERFYVTEGIPFQEACT